LAILSDPPVCPLDFAVIPRYGGWQPSAEKKLTGVVSWLIVDIDVASKVRGLMFVLPPRIGKPIAVFCYQQKFAGPGMHNAKGGLFFFVMDLFYPREVA
jgi:hypothetical protein